MLKYKTILPFLDWMSSYKKNDIKGDISAGLTVGIMLIPQGMAYAMIAGLPPIYGLYASTIPLILYGLFGSSRQLAVGPVAMVSLLTAASVGALATTGTEEYIVLAASLALLSGIILWVLGILRMGFVVNFLSHPVISGFTSAAALIIGMSQLKHLLGISLGDSHHIYTILWESVEKWKSINPFALTIGLTGIFIIKYSKKIHRTFPGALVAVIVGTLAGYFMVKSGLQIGIVGEVPKGFPKFVIPDFNMDIITTLLPSALAISLVGFMESIAVARSVQARHKNYKVVPNQELTALGLANIGTSLFQGFPVTGGFSRTAVNDQAGARTGLASVISAVLILLTLLFLTGLFYYLPKSILAAVIMVAVFGLIDTKEPQNLWKTDKNDFFMLIITFIVTLVFGIEQGIAAGVLLSLLVIIYKTSKPHYAVLGRVKGTSFFRNVKRFDDLEVRRDTLLIRFDADLYYANVEFFLNMIETEKDKKGEDLKYIILNAESISTVDSSGVHALENLVKDLQSNGILLLMVNVKGPVRDVLNRCQFFENTGFERFFLSTLAAIDFIEHRDIGKDHFIMARQSGLKNDS
ncbi:MAG TPA: solute carrier family 26 protein [Saprospiraceae bacterium]|nr:solute carrier family 26 protein [Saprospiraceae bacterium]